jgi:predicted nucleic-acid-binding Zn-ribbon protein
MRKTNLCPKCSSKDLSRERDAIIQSREFFKIISCNKCKFVELYMPDNEEREKKMRNSSIFLWSMIVVGFAIPIGVVLLLVF